MASYVKTPQTALLALQTVAASTVVKTASPLNVSTFLAAALYIRFGREAATAAGAGVNIRIEGSPDTSGDEHWNILGQYTTQFAACSDDTVSGTASIGATTVTLTSITGFAVGDVIFFLNGTIGQSEWHRIKGVSGAVITLEDPLTYAQTGSSVYDSAEIFPVMQVDLNGVMRIRAVSDGALFTQAHAVEVLLVTTDSIG